MNIKLNTNQCTNMYIINEKNENQSTKSNNSIEEMKDDHQDISNKINNYSCIIVTPRVMNKMKIQFKLSKPKQQSESKSSNGPSNYTYNLKNEISRNPNGPSPFIRSRSVNQTTHWKSLATINGSDNKSK